MSDKPWVDGVRRLQAESGGLLRIGIFDLAKIGEVLAAASLGNETAKMLIGALLEERQRILDAPPDRPVLCVACSRPIKKISDTETIYGLLIPSVAQPKTALSFAFCPKCAAADRPALFTKSEAGLRRLWPGLRSVVISHQDGGRA
jgi:hypothetical protein